MQKRLRNGVLHSLYISRPRAAIPGSAEHPEFVACDEEHDTDNWRNIAEYRYFVRAQYHKAWVVGDESDRHYEGEQKPENRAENGDRVAGVVLEA